MIIAHVDMDCFFAACEEKYNPDLKGKPVIIGGLAKRGVVSTANYEARKYGVHSAMPISRAYSLCPDGVYIKPNSKMYRAESQKVMGVLKIFGSRFQQVSVDEAYVEITDYVEDCSNLKEAGDNIRNAVYEETGLTCSIGISDSRRVSKIASDFKKPNGTTIVNNSKEFLKDLEIQKVPGIGKKTSKRMNAFGIFTMTDLAKADKFFLIDNFSKWIIEFQELALGRDKSDINDEERLAKSVSREITFSEDIDFENCFDVIDELTMKVYDDLGDSEFKTVSIKVRYSDFKTITRNYSLRFTNHDFNQIKKAAYDLINKVDEGKIRLLGLKLGNLSHNSAKQISLEAFA